MTRPPAKSPRQDAKAVVEALIESLASEAEQDWNATAIEEAHSLGCDFNAWLRQYARKCLTSTPPTAPDGRVEELERALEEERTAFAMVIRNAQTLLEHGDRMQNRGQFGAQLASHAKRLAALTPAKKGRVKL